MRKSAFTYVEITFVLIIIGVLAVIAVPNFMNAGIRAKVARAKVELHDLALDIDRYYFDHRRYPPFGEAGLPGTDWGAALTTPIVYRTQLPRDPFDRRFAGPARLYPYACMVPEASTGWLSRRTFLGPDEDGVFRFILLSAGPDLSYGMEHQATQGQWTTISPHNVAIYDPSNGTTSEGDLFAAGPF